MSLITYYNGKFMEWSTICDAPLSYFLDEKSFKEHIKENMLPRSSESYETQIIRMERAKVRGTSSFLHESFEDLVAHNRAGLNETTLTIEELWEQFKNG